MTEVTRSAQESTSLGSGSSIIENFINKIKDDNDLLLILSKNESIINEEEKKQIRLKVGSILTILTSGVVKYIEEILFKGFNSSIREILGK